MRKSVYRGAVVAVHHRTLSCLLSCWGLGTWMNEERALAGALSRSAHAAGLLSRDHLEAMLTRNGLRHAAVYRSEVAPH
jgi:hypothetical protein